MAKRKGYYRFLMYSEGVKRMAPSESGLYAFTRKDGVMGIRRARTAKSEYKVNLRQIEKFKKTGWVNKTILRNLVNLYSNRNKYDSGIMAFRRFIDYVVETTRGWRFKFNLDELKKFLYEEFEHYSPVEWSGIYNFRREEEIQKRNIDRHLKRFFEFVEKDV